MNDNVLAANPIKVDFFYVYPWRIRDIVNPELDYYAHLFLFFMRKSDLGFPEDLIDAYDILHLIRARATLSEAFQQQIIKALKAFTKEDFIFANEQFVLNENILESQHWEKIQNILAEENYIDLASIKPPEEEEFNLANKQAVEFRKRIAKTRELVNKYKKNKEVTLGFLINRFCAQSPNINLLNVWDLTFYQFKQQLDATMAVENYTFSTSALLNGRLDPKKQKIIHWTENQ